MPEESWDPWEDWPTDVPWYDDASWDNGEWDDHAEELYICGVATARSDANVWELMIDSGSQSTACRPDFAPQYTMDDSEVARLWDIQDNEIPDYGKKLVDVEFVGDADD